jgi:putative aminopeptidase FrvX
MPLENLDLLKSLCAIHGPSGHERPVRDFLIDLIKKTSKTWTTKPKLLYGNKFQDGLIVVLGKPKTALFAHMDTVGFTVGNPIKKRAKSTLHALLDIGSPLPTKDGQALVGETLDGTPITAKLHSCLHPSAAFSPADPSPLGATLTYAPNFFENGEFIHSQSLDNRLGIFCALEVAKTLKHGALVFSTYEEHGGGSAQSLATYLHKTHRTSQALITDITWDTKHVSTGKGPVISLRDSMLPRRHYLKKILNLTKKSHIPHQLEVTDQGSSDGEDLQKSHLPFDWCFVGVAEKSAHSAEEAVNLNDVQSLINLSSYLIKHL